MTIRVRVREIDDNEGSRLPRIMRRGTGSVVTWRRARMLLLSAQDMPVAKIADLGYQGAGIGIRIPVQPDRPGPLPIENRTHDRLLHGLRALGERAAATLTQSWRALQHVMLGPSRIGAVTQTALVLNQK